jgi:tRNA (guanine-N7-)-methyltransferase
LIAPAFVMELARVLRPGGEFRFATDIADYARTGLTAIMQSGAFSWTACSPADWRNRPDDWPPTRYEDKARAAGRKRYYFRFVRS